MMLALFNDQGSAASVLVGDVLQLVLRGARDSIPNVRFTAVRALQEMAPHLDAGAVDSQVSLKSGIPSKLGLMSKGKYSHQFALFSYVLEGAIM